MTDAAGSSVPEAARATDERAWQYAECLRANTLNLDSIAYPHILVNAFMRLANEDVAAAVAEERATTGRVLERIGARLTDNAIDVQSRGYGLPFLAVPVAAVQRVLRAAPASPGEGE